ncbi:hypothetical protein BT93_J2097 [Corymbia citriodora subsp. variegata]|nr:hypothetical protein BT93_J2097 [Corymbia citriodora subsp. variegata]
MAMSPPLLILKPFLLPPRRLRICSSTHSTSFDSRRKLNLNLGSPILHNVLCKFTILNNLPDRNRASQLNAEAKLVEASKQEAKSRRRILSSEVVMKGKMQVFLGRKWNSMDIENAGIILAIHLLSLLAPFYFSWSALWVAISLSIVTGLFGITLSFHRNLSHRSFKLRKWLEYLFAYCGVLAVQRDPIYWVSIHRYHHQYCDSERDPHSPLEGFWFSHMSWLFDIDFMYQKCGGPNNVGDLQKQPFYRFLHNTYFAHPIALAILLYVLGGVPFLVWGMGVRIVVVYHITWLVNSVCHVWGKQAWNTGDLSRNNWWVAILTFGEGWHNNHHAFEYSARHGLEWWQLDMTWYVVSLLQVLGLATDVKLPNEAQKQRLALNTGIAS